MTISMRLALAIAALACGMGALPARAQTTVTLGSGFIHPFGVAVDAGGNVFVVDTDNSAVKEIVASGGYSTIKTLGSGFANPRGVAVDAAGNLFIADTGNNAVKEIVASSGYVTVKTLAGGFDVPQGVAVDASGNVFVGDTGNNMVKVILASGGYVTVKTLAGGFNAPIGVAVDSSDNVFVADAANDAVKEIVAAGGYLTVNTLGSGFNHPAGVAVDAAGNVFVADSVNGVAKEILASNGYVTVSTLANGNFNSPQGIAVQGGTVFVADTFNNAVKESLAGPATLLASVLPGSRSVQVGHPATIFATMINTGPTTQYDCTISAVGFGPGLPMSYQTTDPATNALIGAPNVPATIPGNGGSQSFLITFQDTFAISLPGLPLGFGCVSGNTLNAAPIVSGVNTIDLTVSSDPVADIIALSATPTHDGVIAVPKGGIAAFAVASANIGVTAPITVSVDTGTAVLPVTTTICQTNPATAQCLAAPTPSVSLNYAGGAEPTFSIFLQANGPIAFAPAMSRIFVRFLDGGKATHGSTSVAIETTP